ncbi:hypothetical protein PR048_010395 [Dryococelus australis]|uniref:Uncharacterized protein n=1 Tax=Dryococelus australis TaxID=614101 RepID=A0ABQ9I3G5_9NEOP|nr:hypothetical protein PR048_010395 [Dryococelus australis]
MLSRLALPSLTGDRSGGSWEFSQEMGTKRIGIFQPLRVFEVSMEQRRNDKEGETGDTRETPSSGTTPTCENPEWPGRGLNPYRRGSGTAVAERLACLPPTRANRVQSPAGSLSDYRMLESCWTMSVVSGFFRLYPVSHAPSFRRCSIPQSIPRTNYMPRCEAGAEEDHLRQDMRPQPALETLNNRVAVGAVYNVLPASERDRDRDRERERGYSGT